MFKKTNIILGMIILCCGFFLGRCTDKKTEVKYIKGDTVIDSIPFPFVVKETIPGEPQWLTKRDTLWKDSTIYVKETVDTLAILADWIKKREYQNVLFDTDTLGKLVIYADVQYNQLQKLKYEFTPIQKNILTLKKPRIEPFIMAGVQTGWVPSFQAGIFYKNFGISYDISIDTYFDNQIRKTTYIHGLKVGYKF